MYVSIYFYIECTFIFNESILEAKINIKIDIQSVEIFLKSLFLKSISRKLINFALFLFDSLPLIIL